MPIVPKDIAYQMIGVVVVTFFLLFNLVKLSAEKLKPVLLAFLFWLVLTGALSYTGWFTNFESLPPRLPLFAAIQMLFLFWLIFFSPLKGELIRLPQKYLIGFQTFRVAVEWVLAQAALDGTFPLEMSFHGRNFDILTGLTAPVLAWWVNKKGERNSKNYILAWNAMGLILLINVVAHGLLSAPYPFKVLELSVDNYLVGYYPFTWLVTFLVPVAFSLHLISIRKTLVV